MGPQPTQDDLPPAPARPAWANLAAGAIIALVGRFLGSAGEAEVGLVVGLLIGAGFGAAVGAIIGIVTVMTRSVMAGIVTGAVVEALIKLTAMSAMGLWWGFTAFGVVVSLVDGAIFGWIVAPQVFKAVKWDKVDA